ncbi:MAG: 50S ribosomal protein L6 [Thermoprotei archaeon]|nr:MAG: 50S ribosomal protein L6 [Thermoprotei archaeon]
MRVAYAREVVEIPSGAEVRTEGKVVRIRGPKAELVKDFSHAPVNIRLENNKVVIEVLFARKKEYACLRTIASKIKNMILGVTKGFRYYMKIVYAHFPMSIKVEGDKVIIENFLGEKAPRIAKIVGKDTKVYVKGDDVIVEGIDVEAVGQTAANIHLATHLTGKMRKCPHGRGGGPGILDGIYLYRKEIIGESEL